MMQNGKLWEQTMWVRGTGGKGSGLLPTFPTPDTMNHIDGTKLRKDNNLKEGGMHGVSLHHYITMFPTPTAIADSNYAAPKHDHEKRILRGVVHDKNLSAHEANLIGQLNPTWVEWLMGYPSGWTDLKVSETQLSRTSPISSESDLKNYAKKTKPKNISQKPR
jgi:hypothetical protein